MLVLRPFQKEALQSLIHEAHTVLIAPTGSGKSLIFQTYLKDFKQNTRAIFVSPLNALARQHEFHFRSLGLNVAQGVGPEGKGPPVGNGVWILNPEKLCGKFRSEVKAWQPNLLIVDEAHCVWEWGDSFRPEFQEIPHLVSEFSIEKSFWCSATLPIMARERITQSLPKQARVLGAFAVPPNLKLLRIHSPQHQRIDQLQRLIKKSENKCGMIFVNTRNSSERVQAYLKAWGVDSVFYHAGMSLEERLALEGRLSNHHHHQKPIWVVATSAFGMGMDYSFLEVCILYEPGFSLLSLAQAVGRVGRAGSNAEATVLWHPDDFHRHAWLTEGSERNARRFNEVKEWCESLHPEVSLEKYFNDGLLSGKLGARELTHEYPE